MTFKIIQYVEDLGFITSMVDEENLGAWCDVRGMAVIGVNANKRHRAELQGAPIIDKLCGPMWDGDVIRYEDSAANEILSR